METIFVNLTTDLLSNENKCIGCCALKSKDQTTKG